MTTMRAIVHERYGPPQTMRLEHMLRPRPGPGAVLVRMKAASVNSWDWDMVVGTQMGRITGPFRPAHRILGADIAGIVEETGPGVTAFAPGDAVFGDLSDGKWGGFADYVLADARALAPIPKGLSFTDAAALPQAGALALQALRLFPGLGPHSSVLFNGAGGGVGTLAIQLIKPLGAEITAVDRAEKREALLALGADAFIDYQSQDFAAEAARYDLIIDVVANRPLRDYAHCLRPGGRLVVIGGRLGCLLRIALFGALMGRPRRQKLGLLVYKVSPEDNAELARRCLAGTLRPLIDSVHSLEQVPQALERLGSGLAIGKVMVTMEEQD